MNEQSIIVELKLFEREGSNLKAFADVTIPSSLGEITIKGFRVIQKEGEAPWVGFPTSSYTKKDGKTVNNQIIETSKSLKRKLTDSILAEYKRATEKVPF